MIIPKLVFLDLDPAQTDVNSKSYIQQNGNSTNWNDASNDFYHSIVFSKQDGCLYTHGLEFPFVNYNNLTSYLQAGDKISFTSQSGKLKISHEAGALSDNTNTKYSNSNNKITLKYITLDGFGHVKTITNETAFNIDQISDQLISNNSKYYLLAGLNNTQNTTLYTPYKSASIYISNNVLHATTITATNYNVGNNTLQQYIESIIGERIASAVVFKGVINSQSDIPSSPATGDMYKISTAGNYSIKLDGASSATSESLKIGDAIVYNTNGWNVIPAGDEVETFITNNATGDKSAVTNASGNVTLGRSSYKDFVTTLSTSSEYLITSKAVYDYIKNDKLVFSSANTGTSNTASGKYLNLLRGSSVLSSLEFATDNGITITSDTNGKITISKNQINSTFSNKILTIDGIQHNLSALDTWRNIYGWTTTSLGAADGQTGELIGSSIGSRSLAFSSAFAGTEKVISNTGTQIMEIDLVWADVTSAGTTYHV